MDFPAGAAAEPAAATAHGHYAGAQGWTVGHAAPAAHQRRTGGQLDGGGLRPWGSSCRTLASNWPSLLALETHGLYPSKWLDPHHVSSLPQCHVPWSWAGDKDSSACHLNSIRMQHTLIILTHDLAIASVHYRLHSQHMQKLRTGLEMDQIARNGIALDN